MDTGFDLRCWLLWNVSTKICACFGCLELNHT